MDAPITSTPATPHDAYADSYDAQVAAHDCYLAEALFGLTYAFIRPGQRLLDVGIGTGLSAAPFTQAGLRVTGMDFAPAMLDLCRAKGVADELQLHDLQASPWPFAPASFDHVIACGVLHFIAGLRPVLAEAHRVLRPGGVLAVTTLEPAGALPAGQPFAHHADGGIDVFRHAPEHMRAELAAAGLRPLRYLRCFVGPDVHAVWVAQGDNTSEP